MEQRQLDLLQRFSKGYIYLPKESNLAKKPLNKNAHICLQGHHLRRHWS